MITYCSELKDDLPLKSARTFYHPLPPNEFLVDGVTVDGHIPVVTWKAWISEGEGKPNESSKVNAINDGKLINELNLQPLSNKEIEGNIESGVACFYTIGGKIVYYSNLSESIVKLSGVIVKLTVQGESFSTGINKKEKIKIEEINERSLKLTKDGSSKIFNAKKACGD